MKYLLSIGMLLAGATLPAGAQEHGAEWYTDFDAAVEVAIAQEKDLLVDFTGSDW